MSKTDESCEILTCILADLFMISSSKASWTLLLMRKEWIQFIHAIYSFLKTWKDRFFSVLASLLIEWNILFAAAILFWTWALKESFLSN